MNIKISNPEWVKFMQEGGQMDAPVEDPNAAPAGAPEAGAEQDPLMQIVQAAAQAVQTQDAQLAMQVCQALVQMAGGGAEQAPQAPQDQEPVFKAGGSLKYWKRK